MSKAALKMPRFKENETFLPVTMKQFESLTNEILAAINTLPREDGHGFDADYAAQIVMSALHSGDSKKGTINKTELFGTCVNKISRHVSFHVVEEIQNRLREAKGQATEDTARDLEALEQETTQSLQ